MPKWIHDRARHLLEKNPSMPEGEAFAIATQQSHAVGKSPKGYGTKEGRTVAKDKYDEPKKLQKTANDAAELAGLGVLAVPSLDHLQATMRARLAKDKSHEGVEKRRFLGDTTGHLMEVGGLGILAAPYIKKHAGLAPLAAKQLIGAGAGAALGAAGGAAASSPGHRVRGALLGGAGGAAVGGAAGFAVPRIQSGMKAGMGFGQAATETVHDAQNIAAHRLRRGATAIAPPSRGAPANVMTRPVGQTSYQNVMSQVAEKNKGRAPVNTGQIQDALRQKDEAAAAFKSFSAPQGPKRVMSGDATGAFDVQPMSTGALKVASLGSTLVELFKEAEGSLLQQVGKNKLPTLSAEAPQEKFRVKSAMAAPVVGNPAKKLEESQQIGIPKMETATVKPLNVKVAFTESQYSGGTGEGRFNNYASYLPPFRKPQIVKPQNVEKRAAALTPRQEEGSRSKRRGVGGMLGGALGLGASHAGFEHVLRSPANPADKSLYQKLVDTAGLQIHGAGSPMDVESVAGPAYYMPKGEHGDPFIYMGDGVKGKPGILAHEMGHHALEQTPAGRAVQNNTARIVGNVARDFTVGASVGALTGASDNKAVRWAGRWAPALAAAPLLMSEAGATGAGLLKMHRAGASGGQLLHAAGQLLPAFGTYLAPAALATGAAHLGQGFVVRRRANEAAQKEKKKIAAMLDELAKLNSVSSPQSQISSSQAVGAPRTTAPPGPSIQQVSKPKGFGRALPGAIKGV